MDLQPFHRTLTLIPRFFYIFFRSKPHGLVSFYDLEQRLAPSVLHANFSLVLFAELNVKIGVTELGRSGMFMLGTTTRR